MPQTPEDLQHIAARTLAHYNSNAQAFWEGTRDHDVRQNINALLDHIEATPPFDILDFGCGPGRDLITFKALGHRAVGLDINANHLKGVSSGWVTGITRPVHIGRSTQVWAIELTNDKGELTCVSRITMAVLLPGSFGTG